MHADLFDLPRREQCQQARLIDGDAQVGNPLTIATEIDQRFAERDAPQSTFDQQFQRPLGGTDAAHRSEEHTSELQSLMRISYAVFCLKTKKNKSNDTETPTNKFLY